MNALKGWNTVIFNIVAAIFGVLEVTDFTDLIPANWQGGIIAVVSLVNLYLRTRTNTPIGRKE